MQMMKELSSEGFFIFRAPYETAQFVFEKKDIGGVILDCIPSIQQGEELCHDLRRRFPALPIGVIVSPDSIPNAEADMIARDTGELSDVIARCRDFFVRACGWTAKTLSTYALTLDWQERTAIYMGYPLKLTPTEHRLLYCLFYHSPRVTGVDDLLTLCYPDGTHRSASNIGVHIHTINRHASRIDPRPLIIHRDGGYCLRDGIL